ncbi:MAG: DUF58 domain-containing protein [Actinobacteria bacterium]|nr:DUF58 domain-containing protein [Actinomycetota bacterium]
MKTPTAEVLRGAGGFQQLELAVRIKLDGLLHGENLTRQYGPGSERGESRSYQPGDDARRIDWSVTARMNELYVRDTIADRELETWLVVDGSASLDFGTADWEKRDLAITAAGAFSLLGTKPGDRTGSIVFDAEGEHMSPPRGGRQPVLHLLRRLEQRPRQDAGRASLASALKLTNRVAKRRGRIVIIADLLDTDDWARELRYLRSRHEVIVAHVVDPREWSLPPVGLVTFVDPETGETFEVQTSSRSTRRRFAAASAERLSELEERVMSSGAQYVRLSTDSDWLLDLVAFVVRSRRLGVPAA